MVRSAHPRRTAFGLTDRPTLASAKVASPSYARGAGCVELPAGGLNGGMNRRSALCASALTGMACLLPAIPAIAQKSAPSREMLRLADYMSAAAHRPLPAAVVEQAKFHVLDTIAAMISGSTLGPGQAAIRHARLYSGTGAATIVASTLSVEPAAAALANGMLAHADETDDSHGFSRSHPGSSVVPSALAAAEIFGIDGQRFLRAVSLGYDVGTRVAIAMGGAAFSYESHRSTHAIVGVFGAAAAAACAANLNAEQMRWVLDYAAQQSAGIAAWQRDKDHIEKAFVFAGMPARNGLTAALLVQSGWNGVDDIFSGDDNYFLAYAPGADLDKLVEQLGERYEVARTDIKKWTVGSPIQAPLDAIEAIRLRRAFTPDEVLRVTVRMAPSAASIVDNREIPDICLQHMVAVMLIDGTISLKAAHDRQRMHDARVLEQRRKVRLVYDKALQALLPVRVAFVEVTLSDGTTVSERVEAVRGTVRNPMSKTEILKKGKDLMTPVIGQHRSDRLTQALLALETVKDIRTLRPLLQTP